MRSASITRTELGLPDLALWDPPSLVLPEGGFAPGQTQWQRSTVTSPWVHGSFLTAVSMQQVTSTLVVHATADSGGALAALVGQVIAAFSQFSYTLRFNYDGWAGAWLCDPADYQVGAAGPVDEFDLSFYEQDVQLSIPRRPVPLLGVM